MRTTIDIGDRDSDKDRERDRDVHGGRCSLLQSFHPREGRGKVGVYGRKEVGTRKERGRWE